MSDTERGAVDAARDLNRLRDSLAAAHDAPRLMPVGLGGVLLGRGVVHRVAELAVQLHRDGTETAVLVDRRPMAAPDGELKHEVETLLAEHAPVRRVELGDDDGTVHADHATLERAVNAVAGAGLLVTVGSGTLTDIGKYVSSRLDGLPHVVVQTAASVNGFADDQSVLVVDGVKRTTPTRWPDWLVIDTCVIRLAPVAMNRAGLGDLLATYTAPADWLLARVVGQDDSFSPAIVALARDHVDAVLESAPGISSGDPDALETLAAALTLSGISMGAAGRTAPGSGMEHTCSHLLEMTERDGATLHGAKVGVLSVFAACLWQIVRAAIADGALARLRLPAEAEMYERVSAAFATADPSGAMAAECWRDYRLKLERHQAAASAVAALAERWPAVDAELERLVTSPERLIAALRRAGAPVRLRQLGIEPERGRWALAHCHLMRERFTVADLAFFLGLWDESGVDAVVQLAERAGGGL